MSADLTIVIPTQGRHTLPRCLASMLPANQGGYRAEILVVADTHSPLLMDVQALCQIAGVEYLEHNAGRHDWGYPQLQRGYGWAQGSHIMNIGDDDIYEPGAFEMIRAAIRTSEPGPLLFRAELNPSRTRACGVPTLIWAQRGRIERCWVTGQNLCAPNDPARLGFWTDDFIHLSETVDLWGGQVTWRDEVIARCF